MNPQERRPAANLQVCEHLPLSDPRPELSTSLVLRLQKRFARPLASPPLLEVLERLAGLDENRRLAAGCLVATSDHVGCVTANDAMRTQLKHIANPSDRGGWIWLEAPALTPRQRHRA